MLRETQIIRLRRSEAQAILEKWWREGMESDVRVLAWKAPGHVFLETWPMRPWQRYAGTAPRPRYIPAERPRQ